jgi:hypothetical protein
VGTGSSSFDKSGVIVKRGRLFVDGEQVDHRAVHWGDTSVRAKLADGRQVKVGFGSGFVGQLKFVRLELDGEPVELREQA